MSRADSTLATPAREPRRARAQMGRDGCFRRLNAAEHSARRSSCRASWIPRPVVDVVSSSSSTTTRPRAQNCGSLVDQAIDVVETEDLLSVAQSSLPARRDRAFEPPPHRGKGVGPGGVLPTALMERSAALPGFHDAAGVRAIAQLRIGNFFL